MSTEETNGFSAPNEDANAPGADSLESAPVGQAAESSSPENPADDMSAFEDQVEDSDLAKALERIATIEDQLARANAELYNQGQEYANYVRRSKEAIPGYKTAGQDEVIESLISVLDDIAAARALNDKLMPLYGAMFCEPSPAAPKWALEKMGICAAHIRLPMLPLTPTGQQKVQAALSAAGLI